MKIKLELPKDLKFETLIKKVEAFTNPHSVLSDAEYLFKELHPIPRIIARPFPPLHNSTSKTFREYSDTLEKWEHQKNLHPAKRQMWEKYNDLFITEKNKFVKEVSGLNKIPKEYQKKVWKLVYEQGFPESPGGHNKIYTELSRLIEIFNKI